MALFLGIDAGGTKTTYVLAEETTVLARVQTGTIKRMRIDAATATAHLDRALRELAEVSGKGMDEVSRTCIGTAGETVPLVVDWLREAFRERVSGDLLLLGDVEIALDAAFPGQGGVLALAGTGSNVAGRVEQGKVTTAGGYGPVLADQGSGHRIGLEALRAAFLARDEGRPTTLLGAFQSFWRLAEADALIAQANRLPAPDFSQLTEVVVRCADDGDAVALDVLQQQGVELGYLVRLVMRRLQASSRDPGWTPPVAFAGSILEKVPAVREALLSSVRQEFPEVHAQAGVVDPVEGALWRARQP